MSDTDNPSPLDFRGRGVNFIEDVAVNPLFAGPETTATVPQLRIPDLETPADAAYQIVHDEAMLDGNARQNLATFVTTWMDDQSQRIYLQAAPKNMIDKDEYPQTAAIETRCWTMLADLWQAPDPTSSIGTSTVGSSEAAMLGGLALKRRWQERRRAEGASTERPNLVMSSAVQVCWEKFCNYFEVEPRYVPISEDHRMLDGHDLDRWVDENTIGVVAILGVTYTGVYEPVREIAAALDAIAAAGGPDVPIHVDAASGGMIAPFCQSEIVWDFRLPRVASINTSGHKYGLVYPGIGWVVWRDRADLPESLIFRVSYLGGDMPTFALNFSRPGAQVLLQYYLFLRLGREGFRKVQQASLDVAGFLADGIADIGPFELWNHPTDIPVFAWRLRADHPGTWDLHHLSERLRLRGWLVPAYPMPDDLADLTVQRIVVRNGFSRDLAGALLGDIRAQVRYLDSISTPLPRAGHGEFTH
ncbi:glutamate decarboxylase [Millisia brevis]|uniref:glutamate decarboxylase n=1 Tax=Millisia brevis TaxID=264148 RepID=UPI000A0401C1|nr:glutamate decarboxylase [Millisia brevis]